ELILWGPPTTVSLRQWDARSVGLGGWTLSPHHVYDPNTQTLYLGDGGRRTAASVTSTITTVAGGVQGVGGENVPAIGSAFDRPQGMAIGADNSLYISDWGNGRIRKVTNGMVSTLATISNPLWLTLAPDGTVY